VCSLVSIFFCRVKFASSSLVEEITKTIRPRKGENFETVTVSYSNFTRAIEVSSRNKISITLANFVPKYFLHPKIKLASQTCFARHRARARISLKKFASGDGCCALVSETNTKMRQSKRTSMVHADFTFFSSSILSYVSMCVSIRGRSFEAK